MNIAQSLQILMKNRNLSRSRLAREIGVHTTTVSNWMDGREPTARNLSDLCDYFGCSLEYLTGKIGESPQKEKSPQDNLEGLDLVEDRAYFKLMATAKTEGISEHDLQLAIDLIRQARKRDEEAE